MTKHSTYLTTALALLVMTSSPTVAQPTGVLRVRVVSPEGKPIWGALVSIRGDSGRYWDGLRRTAEDGGLSRTIRAGSYQLTVSASGHRTRTDSFTLIGSDTVRREVILASNRRSEIGGLHVGGPGAFSLSAGHAYLIQPALGRRSRIDQSGMLFAVVEPGVKAGRVSAGYIRMTGNLGTGWSVRGTVLQRWSPTNDLYGGAELGLMMFGMGPRVGFFKPLRGLQPRRSMVFWNFSIGV